MLNFLCFFFFCFFSFFFFFFFLFFFCLSFFFFFNVGYKYRARMKRLIPNRYATSLYCHYIGSSADSVSYPPSVRYQRDIVQCGCGGLEKRVQSGPKSDINKID
ncbi:hypothetical protein ACN42_g8247 [Penicillium freii]|uniref:Uncharacterized protein n=1 Tax=Penicillium freii TaxID=48697 RepID=A0A124GQQ8_PENFR|nr:hypothetical protein ACN42_g8247 [Penicillium freii]